MADRNEQTMISFKVDSVVKESAEAVLTGSGLNTSAYLGMCLRKLAQGGEVPFDLKVDSMFWVGEAKVSKAAAHIKSGAFHKALAIQSETGKFFEMELCRLLLKLACDEKTGAVIKVLFKDILESRIISGSSTSISLIRSCTDHIIVLITSSGDPYADDLVSQIRSIANQADERAASLIRKSNVIDLAKESTASNEAEEPGWDFELVDSIVATVLDTYKENKDQLAMRFVGAEFGFEEVEKASNKRDDLAELVEKASQKIDSDKEHEFEQMMIFAEMMNGSNR